MQQENSNLSSDSDQAALEWLIRLTSGKSTSQEQEAFDNWIAADPAHRHSYENILKVWKETEQLGYDQKTGRVTIPNHPPNTKRRKRKRSRNNWQAPVLVTTSILATCLLGIWWMGWHWLFISDYTTHELRQTVHLSDGVTMTLDAQTVLDINELPGQTQVTLRSGAAWFKVDKTIAEHTVQVLTDELSVTSLGTEFLVEHRGPRQFVAVTEHAVELTSRSTPSQHTRLEEGYGISLDAESTVPWREMPIDPAAIGAWRHGRLIFENVSLQQVIQRLDDYHPGILLITDNILRYQKVSGVFDIEHPNQALASLKAAFPLTIRRLSPYLVLLSRA